VDDPPTSAPRLSSAEKNKVGVVGQSLEELLRNLRPIRIRAKVRTRRRQLEHEKRTQFIVMVLQRYLNPSEMQHQIFSLLFANFLNIYFKCYSVILLSDFNLTDASHNILSHLKVSHSKGMLTVSHTTTTANTVIMTSEERSYDGKIQGSGFYLIVFVVPVVLFSTKCSLASQSDRAVGALCGRRQQPDLGRTVLNAPLALTSP